MTDHETLAESAAIYLDANVLVKIDVQEEASEAVRCLIYGSRIPVFCSLVAFGEFVAAVSKKPKQERIGAAGYLYSCRALLKELDIGAIQRIEPPDSRVDFINAAEPLLAKYSKLGGGDIWHLLAAQRLAVQQPPATLLSFDRKLVEAARQENLRAVNGMNVNRDALIRELRARNKWVAV